MVCFFTYWGDYVLNYDTGARATLCVQTPAAAAAERRFPSFVDLFLDAPISVSVSLLLDLAVWFSAV